MVIQYDNNSVGDMMCGKPLEMEDVPCDVWYAVYRKWTRALLFGWSQELWNRCELCHYLKGEGIGCSRCPLFKDSWCRGGIIDSRLSISYHLCNEDDWAEDIKKFVDMVKPYRKA